MTRERAIERVRRAADLDWLAMAEAAALSLRGSFTTDDVVALFPEGGPETHEPRALGAVMRRLAKAGAIRATPHYIESKSETCHRRPKRVWESVEGHARAVALKTLDTRLEDAAPSSGEGAVQGSLFDESARPSAHDFFDH